MLKTAKWWESIRTGENAESSDNTSYILRHYEAEIARLTRERDHYFSLYTAALSIPLVETREEISEEAAPKIRQKKKWSEIRLALEARERNQGKVLIQTQEFIESQKL